MENSINAVVNYEKEIEGFFSTRSRFYNLEPIGMGTPYVESLSSYISRLAIIHNVSLVSLLKVEVSSFLSKEYLKKELSEGITKSSMYINENSIITLDYVYGIESITGRNDLINLTMLNWSGIFPYNLRSKYRKWCPICLSEMEPEPRNIYEPLIWYMSSIRTCDIHKIELKDKCPNCNRSLPFLHSKYKVGYCQFCDCFLGEHIKFCKVKLSKEDEFILLNYKELIENIVNAKTFPTKFSVSLLLNKIMEEVGFNTVTSFADFIGYNPGPVNAWIRQNKIPSHKILINIVQKFNSSIYKMIYNKDIKLSLDVHLEKPIKRGITPISIIEYHLNAGINSNNPKGLQILAKEVGFAVGTARKHLPLLCSEYEKNYLLYKKNRELKKQREVESILKEYLHKAIPISLIQCVRENGLSFKVVKRLAPELSERVSKRYKDYISESKNKRISLILSDIRTIAVEMNNNGTYPSREGIEKKLGSIVFLEKEIREGWKDIMLELGYKLDK